ncbi:methyl-accepting chemotaxis protein [Erythrobacter sp. LQ02-29]|uniref:methyl-accepting chemotaxis protein n=1 Tax=Erythrobacter sp. LQ02-29 TaxID=2920384 RepID=UPI001F4D4F89|nr:methyl-accepting chemotaxis protein [Erythrobacter sp. LQ02-29]MCP9222821.1 methyl-accepting chemotaxis protein [Erythrobacter sp. LQ02-29]
MLSWFRENAPIRRKFDVITFVFAAIVAVPVFTTVTAVSSSGAEGWLLFPAFGALVAAVAAGLIFKNNVCDPYVGTVVRMEGLAAGDLSSPIEYTTYTDCVGRMTRAMDVFRKNGETVRDTAAAQERIVAELGEGLSKLAVSDLTHRIDEPFPSEYEKLRNDFNRASEALSDVVGAVIEAANGINNGASDIRQASDDLSQRTEQQAASLEETAAAMDEITGTVRETAEGANRANAIVGETRNDAQQSGEIVRRAVESMNGIERSSGEISEIISVIDGIAFQTNLLALNAGVEAARAGDAGKGFAVVASEVRALAQRSAEAAKDVKAKITASSDQVELGVGLVSETGQALERIITRIAEVADLVETIAASAKQQSTGLQQVNTAVSEMDGVTQQNAAMVEEATAAARSLAEEATTLNQQVSQFRLLNSGTAPRSTGNPVHRLQAQAANINRAPTAPQARRVANGGTTSFGDDDWSEF